MKAGLPKTSEESKCFLASLSEGVFFTKLLFKNEYLETIKAKPPKGGIAKLTGSTVRYTGKPGYRSQLNLLFDLTYYLTPLGVMPEGVLIKRANSH